MEFDARTLEVLEWPQIQKFLVEACRSPLGREIASHWGPGSLTKSAAESRARAVAELLTFHKETELHLPIQDLEDIRPILKRIERSGAISVEEFASIVRTHKSAQGLFHFLSRYPSEYKNLQRELTHIDLLNDWAKEHFELLDLQGEIVDDATEDLFALRKLARDLHEGIKHRLNDFLHNPRYAELMQDFYVTVRQGRYVIPVKSNFKGRVPGIIHDLSKTENTLFIEPEDIVDYNNKLKVAEKEIELEIEKILAGVVAKTQPFLKAFFKNVQVLGLADFLEASSRFVGEIGGDICVPTWKGKAFEIVDLRHPLLALRERIVASSLDWEKGFVLTGPNTGGKTVLLKGVGLSFCMARAGLPVAAKSLVFPEMLETILVDIGDEQDLGQDLSTFSAHLKILERFYRAAGPDTLIMIDEIATATAPEEGECLAQAYLDKLLDKGTSFFVTTHYGRVKNFAMADKRCRIAAMGFRSDIQKPNYQIILDIPGESSALATAENLGLDLGIVNKARQLLGAPNQDTANAVRRLEEAREIAEEQFKVLQEEKAVLLEKQRQAEEKKRVFEEKLRTHIEIEAKNFLKEFSTLREELSRQIKEMTPESLGVESPKIFSKLAEGVGKMRENISGIKEEADPMAFLSPMPLEAIQKEAFVEITGLGLGKVFEVPQGKMSSNTLIVVQVGELRTRVSASRLRLPSKNRVDNFEAQEQLKHDAQRRKSKLHLHSEPGASTSTICDVRGRSVEEAMSKVEMALTGLLGEEGVSVTIIHGHGSEKLKDRIRSYLKRDRDDLAFRPGSWPGEGGDGVTVVEKAY